LGAGLKNSLILNWPCLTEEKTRKASRIAVKAKKIDFTSGLEFNAAIPRRMSRTGQNREIISQLKFSG